MPTPEVPGWDPSETPFHSGEIAVQERAGVREKMDAPSRRAVRRFMPDQHREFYTNLAYFFVASVDATGQPWASMLLGQPGFLSTPDAVTLRVRSRPLQGDPLAENLHDGAEVAGLGIELSTRRRNRVIGTASDVGPEGFSVRVRQTLGICPKYIQARAVELLPSAPAAAPHPVHHGVRLDGAARAVVGAADTFFVASVDPREEDGLSRGADVSHRGGRPGFVRMDDDHTLTTPDFAGNSLFNTLGNFVVEPRAGLLFIDFARGDLLYLAARAEVIWDGDEVRSFAGAQRLVRYAVERVIRVEGSLPARFSAPSYSPHLAGTGSWT